MIHPDNSNSTTLLRRPNPMRNQSYSNGDSLRSCNAAHEYRHKFDQCLSCGKFHPFNSCVFRNSKRFKCGKIGHIQSVCNIADHFSTTHTKFFNSDRNKLSISNDHLSLSKTAKSGTTSHSCPELIEIPNQKDRIPMSY